MFWQYVTHPKYCGSGDRLMICVFGEDLIQNFDIKDIEAVDENVNKLFFLSSFYHPYTGPCQLAQSVTLA